MPIVWHYLLKNYLKVLFLCLFSFIAVLLVSRIEEIAHIASMGPKLHYLLLFILYQIPFILPIALPISCLISALLLFQRLSQTQELTALRAAGFSLRSIAYPLIFAAWLLSLLNFYITSELATSSHFATRKMLHQLTSINPLVLLQNAKISTLKNSYIQMAPLHQGTAAKDMVLVLPHPSLERLQALTIKTLHIKDEQIVADQVGFISSLPQNNEHKDHLLIENQVHMESAAPEFTKLLYNKGWKIADDHLTFRLLRAKIRTLKEEERATFHDTKLKKCYSEIVRRFSLGFSAFSLTILGIAFGMDLRRHPSKKGIYIVFLLTALTLICFFAAKTLSVYFFASTALFLLPHCITLSASFWNWRRIHRGIE